MAMGETIEVKFLGVFEYILVGLFIVLLLLLYVVDIPGSITAVVPELECCGV